MIMGKDIHIYVEWKDDMFWNRIGVAELGKRSYEAWNKWDNKGIVGTPEDLSYELKYEIKENPDLFGWHWLPMEDFYKLKKAEVFLPDIYKKSEWKNMRVIWSYDW